MPTRRTTVKVPTVKVRVPQAQRSARTRAALLSAARSLFADQGFAQTGREEIAERAGVTRGALYHHFDSKAAVMLGVVEQLEAELVDRVVRAAEGGEGFGEQLSLGCRAYMDACADPSVARLLVEAPVVLGPDVCRALDAASCVPLLLEVFDRAGGENVAVPGRREVAARLLLGLLNEAATLIATAPENSERREAVTETVDAFLSKLFAVT